MGQRAAFISVLFVYFCHILAALIFHLILLLFSQFVNSTPLFLYICDWLHHYWVISCLNEPIFNIFLCGHFIYFKILSICAWFFPSVIYSQLYRNTPEAPLRAVDISFFRLLIHMYFFPWNFIVIVLLMK